MFSGSGQISSKLVPNLEPAAIQLPKTPLWVNIWSAVTHLFNAVRKYVKSTRIPRQANTEHGPDEG